MDTDFPHANAIALPAEYDADDQFEKIRDFRDLTTENLSNGTLQFFPPNPTQRDSVARQYEDNPLPRNNSKSILSMGFVFNKIVQEAKTGITPLRLINSFRHAEVRFQTDQGRTTVLEQHLLRYCDFNEVYQGYAAFNDGANSAELPYVCLPTKPLFEVPDNKELLVGPDERFELEVEFDDTTGIPSQSDYDQVLQVGAFAQVNHDPF